MKTNKSQNKNTALDQETNLKPETELNQNALEDNKPDTGKRELLLGLGSVFSMLTACAPPQNTNRQPPTAPSGYESLNESISAGDDIVDAQTHMMPCPATPPGAVPTPPPAGCGVGGPPAGVGVGGPPAGVGPGTGVAPGAGVTPAQGVVSASQTFNSLGPANIVVSTSDMMASPQLMSDGTSVSVWGFTDAAGAAFNGQTTRLCPGPVLEVIEGQSSIIQLSSMHPHTMHLHGLDVNTANDGVPGTSGYVSSMPMAGAPMPGGIPAPDGANLGSPFNYTFVAPHAGTYMYHCHVDTVLHMEMGMSGVVIVRPGDGNRNVAYTGGATFSKEYIWQLHTFDSSWHNGALSSGANTQRYSPNYFMINGLDGANLLSDSATAISGVAGETILVRLVNLGYMPAMVNFGGLPFNVESSDGRPLKSPLLSLSELLIGPGERYDVFMTLPPAGIRSATVNYMNIMGIGYIGQAVSSITST